MTELPGPSRLAKKSEGRAAAADGRSGKSLEIAYSRVLPRVRSFRHSTTAKQ